MTKYSVLLTCLLFMIVPVFSWPIVHPVGTTLYNPERAGNGYTLFTPVGKNNNGTSTVHLINMNGEVVHQWNVPLFALHARLLPNGNLLFLGQSEKATPGRPGVGKFWIGGAAGTIMEMTWDGQVVFQNEDLNMHHDAVKLPNGHYLYLAWERVPGVLQARVRGGIQGSEFPDGVMFNDYLVEVDGQGRVVWKWHANAHLNPDIDIIGPFYKREEWCHGNALAVLPNGNIVLTGRSLDSIMIINRQTGDIIFRWGNTAYLDKNTGRIEYRNGPAYAGGPHSAEVIAAGLPGAGHIIGYDNGLYNFASRAVEVDVKTAKLIWQSSQPGIAKKHFSDLMGSSQRMPNGNTLICDGANGRFFEETPQHGVVWEYQSPYITDPLLQGAVLRIHRYPPGYCRQFKSLPAAGGPAVIPAGNTAGRIAQNRVPNAAGDEASVMRDLAGQKYLSALLFIVSGFILGVIATAIVSRRKRLTSK